jgi:hypothetical protein
MEGVVHDGGAGSGNWGHAGRPGKQGGSAAANRSISATIPIAPSTSGGGRGTRQTSYSRTRQNADYTQAYIDEYAKRINAAGMLGLTSGTYAAAGAISEGAGIIGEWATLKATKDLNKAQKANQLASNATYLSTVNAAQNVLWYKWTDHSKQLQDMKTPTTAKYDMEMSRLYKKVDKSSETYNRAYNRWQKDRSPSNLEAMQFAKEQAVDARNQWTMMNASAATNIGNGFKGYQEPAKQSWQDSAPVSDFVKSVKALPPNSMVAYPWFVLLRDSNLKWYVLDDTNTPRPADMKQVLDIVTTLPEIALVVTANAQTDTQAILQDGGPGSGNFGHAGRPGVQGGSAKGNKNISYKPAKTKPKFETTIPQAPTPTVSTQEQVFSQKLSSKQAGREINKYYAKRLARSPIIKAVVTLLPAVAATAGVIFIGKMATDSQMDKALVKSGMTPESIKEMSPGQRQEAISGLAKRERGWAEAKGITMGFAASAVLTAAVTTAITNPLNNWNNKSVQRDSNRAREAFTVYTEPGRKKAALAGRSKAEAKLKKLERKYQMALQQYENAPASKKEKMAYKARQAWYELIPAAQGYDAAYKAASTFDAAPVFTHEIDKFISLDRPRQIIKGEHVTAMRFAKTSEVSQDDPDTWLLQIEDAAPIPATDSNVLALVDSLEQSSVRLLAEK